MSRKIYARLTWIVLLLISVVVLLVSINTIHINDLTEIKAELRNPPEERIYGGDIQRRKFVFYTTHSSIQFSLSGCSYRMADKEKFLNLKKGDHVRYYVRKEKPLTNKSEVYELSSNKDIILSSDAINRCKTRDLYLLTSALIVMIFYLIYDCFQLRRKLTT